MDKNEDTGIYISEAGLYELMMKSETPLAKQFQKMVYEVYLPNIRKYGQTPSNPNNIRSVQDFLNEISQVGLVERET